jgi:hypothetical protein
VIATGRWNQDAMITTQSPIELDRLVGKIEALLGRATV